MKPFATSQIEQPVVVRSPELARPSPSRVVDDAGRYFVYAIELLQEIEHAGCCPETGNALSDVRDEDVFRRRGCTLSERDRHAAFGVVLGDRPRQLEALALVVQERRFGPVVVGG